MQSWLIAASVISVLTGFVHSLLGELLIFRHLRGGGLIPATAVPPLRERHVRILWATWHLASIFGFAFAAVLFRLGVKSDVASTSISGELTAIALANLAAGLLVLGATRGRHPGWLALLSVGTIAAVAGLGLI